MYSSLQIFFMHAYKITVYHSFIAPAYTAYPHPICQDCFGGSIQGCIHSGGIAPGSENADMFNTSAHNLQLFLYTSVC